MSDPSNAGITFVTVDHTLIDALSTRITSLTYVVRHRLAVCWGDDVTRA